jgi:hypothetical protein
MKDNSQNNRIHEKLYFYRYSFRFPNLFLQQNGKNDRRIKLAFIQTMTQTSLRKEFQIQSLFDTETNETYEKPFSI